MVTFASDEPCPPTSGDVTYRFVAEADTYVEEAQPDANRSADQVLLVDGSPRMDTYARFDVNGIHGGRVTAARLRFHAIDPTGDRPQVFLTDPNWGETALTWRNRPAITSGVLYDAGAIAAPSDVEFDVTAGVSGNGAHSFLLAPTSGNGVDFTGRPELIVTVEYPLAFSAMSTDPLPGEERTEAIDLNSRGTVLVLSSPSNRYFLKRADGSMLELNLPPNHFARALNARGVVVGDQVDGTRRAKACHLLGRWSSPRVAGPHTRRRNGRGRNQRRRRHRGIGRDGASRNAVLWRGGVIVDLGSPPFAQAQGRGISEAGHVVGEFEPKAFRWTAATGASVLPMLPQGYDAIAYSVNSAGTAVGAMGALYENPGGAVIWFGEGVAPLSELVEPAVGLHSCSPSVVNDAGQIAASTETRAVLLTPFSGQCAAFGGQ